MNKFYNLFIAFLIVFLINKSSSLENKIIFKINDNVFTTYDYEMRVKYLEFVGDNTNLSKEIIMSDFISANIFYEHYKKLNIKNNFNDRVNEIYENIKDSNQANNRTFSYNFDKENILLNIKKDFIRKTILQEILNTNLDNIKMSSKDIDLLYDIKIQYINFQNTNDLNFKIKLSELNDINFKNVISLLQKNNVDFFLKEHEVIDINNIDKKIKNNILSNIDYFIFENNNDFSIIFIDKKFETFESVNVNLFSVKSKSKKNPELLKCEKLAKNVNQPNILSKQYKFSDLNKELKENLLNINDFIVFNNNDEYVYVILCGINFDKDILNNFNINKLIDTNVSVIENKFIKKYSKIYNLIKFDA